MERCDFASITTTIRNYLMDGSFDSQPDFLYSLFDAYAQETGACFDNGLSNKWLNGLVRVSADIGRFYHDNPEQRAKLAETLRKNIFTRMPDSAMAVREVYELLIRDESVSEREKGILCGDYPDGENADDAAFLADVLVFGMVHLTLKELGGVLKAMAYMDMATGHKERAELSVWKVLYVYSVLYADDPAYMEHEMKQIVEICKEHRLRVAFPAVSPV